ncbi:MAG: hypothetical protein HOL07_11160 [Rhodospirillaceae bacterium]|jgi:hypothetical protein|nr:hypothetical protein [Rhodospirillaceae bacterium]MBT3809081.1 hypothetical protein [Rhodospirillaceae bacterium]MBT3931676.1 hypothetical protein [Rhodospirillaceae bacterium]MBT4773664.1 hypothetical protein [Rhodospirillaceae bacterium]MBT5358893.1 hypothetical protein [Rhodospirillaceae bacterium]
MSTPIKIQASGVYLQATTSTGDRVAMPGYGAGAQVLAYNDSAQLAFIDFGASDVAAVGGTSAPNIPIPPGAVMALTRPAWATHVSGITNADTADLYFSFGEGA